MKELKLSPQSRKDIEESIERLAIDLQRIMTIIEADHMRVSLDLNFESTGGFAGIKYSVFKAERTEHVYDFNPELQPTKEK